MTWLGIVVLTLGVGAWLMDRDHKRKLKDCEESWKHDMKIMTDGRDEFMKDLLKERDARKAADKALVDCRRDAESAIAEWQAHAEQWQQVAQANQAANKDFSQAYREVLVLLKAADPAAYQAIIDKSLLERAVIQAPPAE